jgi:hypothetical protein
VRLFLDAHISGPKIASQLRACGHDVRSADEERSLDGCPDEELLAMVAREGRILVTFNARDFARICRDWGAGHRHHAGCMILVGLSHHEFGLMPRRIEEALTAWPREADWRDLLCFVGRRTL